MKKEEMPGLSAKERFLIDAFMSTGNTIVRNTDLVEMGYDQLAANLTLSRLQKKGWLQRLKSGVYRIIPLGTGSNNAIPEDIWAIAMEIFQPAYLGGWTAAEYWDLTEQIFNTTMVFSSSKQKKTVQKIAGLSFRIKLIHKKQFFGISKIWSNNKQIQISDIHRTIIDILDEPGVGGGGRSMIDIAKAYYAHPEVNPEKLLGYATELNHSVVFKRLGFIAEHLFKSPESLLKQIEMNCKKGVVLLDPHGPVKGAVLNRWGLRLNIPTEDFS